MALQTLVILNNGVTIAESYSRILSVENRRDLEEPQAGVGVEVFKDATSRTQGLNPCMNFRFVISGGDYTSYFNTTVLDQTNVNDISQTYMYMKTQSSLNGINYTGAIDV